MRRAEILFVISLLLFCAPGCRKQEARHADHPLLLTIAHETPYLTLDPQVENDNVTWSVLSNIYEPLVRFDREMKIRGGLADRWENPNDLTWRFYLRPNVRFHNGKRLTARDVVYTIERGISPAFKGVKAYLIAVTGARAIDELTVDITTDRPNPLLLNRLTFILIIPADPNPTTVIESPVGTGPYRFARRSGAHSMLLEANRDYWGPRPEIQNVQMVSFESEYQPVRALVKEQIQVTRQFPESLIPDVRSCAGCELISDDSLSVTILGFNLLEKHNSPILKRSVRQAIQLAIDSEDLVSSLKTTATTADQLVSLNVFGYDPEYHAVKTDRQKARQLLASAGYPSGFSIDLYGNDALRLNKLAGQLSRIGITARTFRVQWDELMSKMKSHEIPMFTLSWVCSTGDASDFLDALVHTPDATGYGSLNFAGYHNVEIDRLIEQSGQTLRISERKKLLQTALSRTMEELPYIPLYSRYSNYAVSKKLSWQPRRDGRLYAAEMRWKDSQ